MRFIYRFVFSFTFFVFHVHLIAQSSFDKTKDFGQNKETTNSGAFKVIGIVRDSLSNQMLEYATVSLFRDSSLVSGGISNHKGEFTLLNISPGLYRLKIDFVGYSPKYISFNLLTKDNKLEKNIGTVLLASSDITLSTTTIVATKSVMASSVDKKVFYAEQLLTAQGGTITDVLNNVPSVTIDNDGKPSLRGSENVTVLIDGKPSGLAGTNLSQIPASNIKAIEVITNPSAKYDPDGTAGIINIILKKNTLQGFNGQATVGGGTPKQFTSALQLNYLVGKWNFSSNGNVRFDERNAWSHSYRYFTLNPNLSALLQNTDFVNKSVNYSGRFSVDYYLNEKSTISSAITYNQNNKNQFGSTIYEQYDLSNNLDSLYRRDQSEIGPNKTFDVTVNFRHDFEQGKQHYLAVDITRSASLNETDWLFDNYSLDRNTQEILTILPVQKDFNLQDNTVITSFLDYARPLGKKMQLEAGAKNIRRKWDNNYQSTLIEGSVVTNNLPMTNHFVYDETLYALYTTVAAQMKGWQWKLGLRAEQMFTQGNLLTTNDVFDNDYFSLFPTGNLSFELNKHQQIQLSYSRRINRPQPNALNPFQDVSDPYNQRYGNPALQPEYVHSIDLGYNWRFMEDKMNFTTSAYYRRTDNGFVRILKTDSLGVLRVKLENAAISTNYGLESSLIGSPFNWWNFNLSANVFRNELDVSNLDPALNNTNMMAIIKIINTWKIAYGIDIQLSSWYNTPRNTPQGKIVSMGSTDINIRKRLWNGKGNISLTVNDIFDMTRFGVNANGEGFSQNFERKRQTRTAMLTFLYKFGKSGQEGKKSKKGRGEETPAIRGGGEGMDF